MKLARVNLEAESFADPRFALLERLLGLPAICGGKLGLARCAVIWSWQTEHYTPEEPCFVVPEWVIEMALEGDGAVAIAALVRARLAEETPDGLRMKGSDHERTGWLWRLRQKSAAGVEAKRQKAAGNRKADNISQPVVGPGLTRGGPEVNPLGSLLSVQGDPESLSSAGAREPDDQTPAAPPPVASATTQPAATVNRGHDLFAALAEELHDRHAAEARKLKAAIKGCENVSIGGGPLMGETRGAVLDVVSRWAAEARELGADTREHVTARMDHLVKVRSATARREKHLRWWTSGRFWRWGGIEIDLGQTVEQSKAAAEKPREGARFGQERPAPMPAVGHGPAPVVVPAAERAAAAEELAVAKRALGIVDDQPGPDEDEAEVKEAVDELKQRLAAGAGGTR